MKRFIQHRNKTYEEVILLQKMFFHSLKWRNLFRSYNFCHFINYPQKKPTVNDIIPVGFFISVKIQILK